MENVKIELVLKHTAIRDCLQKGLKALQSPGQSTRDRLISGITAMAADENPWHLFTLHDFKSTVEIMLTKLIAAQDEQLQKL